MDPILIAQYAHKVQDAHGVYGRFSGEKFKGRYAGEFNLADSSKAWRKITVSDDMKRNLQCIVTSFNEIFWKGYHNGTLYVDCDAMMNLNTDYNFKIVTYDYFEITNCIANYPGGLGFYFIVQMLPDIKLSL